MTNPIESTLTDIQESVVEFKQQHQEKLMSIETSVQHTNERLDRVEVALKRPLVSESTPVVKTSDFLGFIRKGYDEISHKALISSNDASAGYLIPTSAVQLINQHLEAQSPIRRLATVATISNDCLDLLMEKSEADVGWVAETAERGETGAPELAKISIPVHEVYAKPRVSQRLLDDSAINIENWLAARIADRMAKTENQAFLYGDGEGKPKGILTYPTVAVGQGTWGQFESVTADLSKHDGGDNLIEAFYSLKSEYLQGACWIMSRGAAARIRKLKDKSGAYLWQQSLAADSPNTLLGYPVYLCDDMADKDANTVLFGNLRSAYQVVDRSHMNLLRDPYSAKPYVEFYATKRVGGDVINFDALKVIKIA